MICETFFYPRSQFFYNIHPTLIFFRFCNKDFPLLFAYFGRSKVAKILDGIRKQIIKI